MCNKKEKGEKCHLYIHICMYTEQMTEMATLMQGPPGPPGRGRPGRPGLPGPQGRPGTLLSIPVPCAFQNLRPARQINRIKNWLIPSHRFSY